MNLWEFLVAVVAIEAFAKTIRALVLAKSQNRSSSEHNAAILERLDKLEKRMNNLETIVLEVEKHKQFDRAL